MMQHNEKLDIVGTYLIGYFRATYKELENVLGKPESGDEYKSSTEWRVEHLGKVFTIYDWKTTNLYECYLNSVENFRQCEIPCLWHIGGHNAEFFDSFIKVLDYEIYKKILNVKVKYEV